MRWFIAFILTLVAVPAFAQSPQLFTKGPYGVDLVNFAALGAFGGVTSASVKTPGTNYSPGDVITLGIPNSVVGSPLGLSSLGVASTLYVMNTQVVSATVHAAGSGCAASNNTAITVTGTTGTGGSGAYFTASVNVINGGIAGPVSIITGGQYQVNPTVLSAEPITGSSCSGSQLSVVMGVAYVQVQIAGAYSVLPAGPTTATQFSTTGSGIGATFNINFGIISSYVFPPSQAACSNLAPHQCAYAQAEFSMGVGYLTLSSITSGLENTAIGWMAGSALTSGSFNTIVGIHALGANATSASRNTVIGIDAMRDVVSSSDDIAIGQAALREPSADGGGNVAIGENTMLGQSSTSGGSNVAVGNNAMASTSWSTAGFNTCIGDQCGAVLTSGNGNVFVGYNSGATVTSGGNNITIGPNVGSTTLATGSRNILIGTSSSGNCDATSSSVNDTFELCQSAGSTPLLYGNLAQGTPFLAIGATSAANTGDLVSGVLSSNGRVSLTINNVNSGSSAQSSLILGNGTANNEGQITLNGSNWSGFGATNDLLIGSTSGRIILGNSGTSIGELVANNGNIMLFNQPTTGSITYAVCAASGANGGSGGALILDTSATICGISSKRFKNIVGFISEEEALAGLEELHAGVWTYKDKKDMDSQTHVSLYAEDVEKMDTRCVVREKDGRPRNYEDRCVVAYLVTNMQRLQREVASLKRQQSALLAAKRRKVY